MIMDKRQIYRTERDLLINYIYRQTVGPFDGNEECLYNDKPTERYLMGTLYPQNTDTALINDNEDQSYLSSVDDEVDDSPLSMIFQRLPASMGISFYVQNCDALEIDIWGGCYRNITKEDISLAMSLPDDKSSIHEDGLRGWPKWIRQSLATELAPETITVASNYKNINKIPVLEARAQIHTVWRHMGQGALITVSILNAIEQNEADSVNPEQCLFQVGFKCRPINGIIYEYPSISRLSYDEEEEELALQYRKNITYAVGHGCAATWEKMGESPESIQTITMPICEVRPVTTVLNDIKIDMTNVLSLQYLANESIESVELVKNLEIFIAGYSHWYDQIYDEKLDHKFDAAKKRITNRIQNAIVRMKKGVELLGNNKNVRKAFALANFAMLKQMIHTGNKFSGSEKNRDQIPYLRPDYRSQQYKEFAWRPFQLAFQLLVLESMVNPNSDDHSNVDLLWFPTGGGKTEAYFALAAFELIYRRIVYGEEGAGTSVIKRYTLRLLTTQQFQRAATLVCAIELMRKENQKLLGKTPFKLGLWVGEASSPNKYTSDSDHSKGAYELYKDMLEEDRPENPFQLQICPWCGTKIVPYKRTEDEDDYGVRATQTSFKFFCTSSDCELHEAIPVTVVDEDIFECSPSFIIGTVDKFARLAWDDRASSMFGHPTGKHRPPSLIIQDELHLISGPLGTIAGVYEAGISTIIEARGGKPKVIAATATIRRAADQVQRLYGSDVRIFPPPGISSDDSYFARIDHKASGRIYIGVMGQGHSPITTMVHTSAVLSQSVLENKIGDVAKDSWWTQVIYHNSRRELGKTMTLARDDIPERVKVIASNEDNMRGIDNVEELSANVRGIEIPKILSRLKKASDDKEVIDILPCTNMISVGVDVNRLGLMLIVGQPKTTAEYIQASSRVGRDDNLPPGIVVTLYSGSKPRDRSHYENFEAYHNALYRAVEPTSVTPFASPSRDRALHAAIVILVRHACGLGANNDADKFDPQNAVIKKNIDLLVKRMIRAEPAEEVNIVRHVRAIVDEWTNKILTASSDNKPLRYSNKAGRQYASLLKHFGENDGEGWPTLNSMRNVDMASSIKITGED